jgi:hypothetical protein
MRTFIKPFSLLVMLFSVAAFSQTKDIYKLTFGDPSNFDVIKTFGNETPEKILIIDTTAQWNPERFWIRDLNAKSPETLAAIGKDEHSAYNRIYLFKDTVLSNYISDSEKILLSQRAAQFVSRKISLKGANYRSISNSNDLKGFYVVTTEPIFSSDGKYAFIDMIIFQKTKLIQAVRETYFATTCIIYQKQSGNKWNRIRVVNRLIL